MSGSRLPVLLVNPSARTENYGALNTLSAIEPPLWCALLAGWIRKGSLGVDIMDAEVEGWTIEETAQSVVEADPLLAVIVVMGLNPSVSSTPKMDAANLLAERIKTMQPDIKVMLAGLHPSALPERTLTEYFADYVCEGEGFYTITNTAARLMAKSNPRSCGGESIPGLWEYYKGGMVRPKKAIPIQASLLGQPAWDLLPMTRYRAHNWHSLADLDHRTPYGVVATSFGCPFGCSYCNIHTLYGGSRTIRYRPLFDVMKELETLAGYGIKNLKIWDEMFGFSQKKLLEFCDALIERDLGFNIWSYARVNTVTPRGLERMKKAGINWLCYGFESASQQVRQGVGKRTSSMDFANAVHLTRREGINIIANYLVGLPDDSLETMEYSLREAEAANFEWLNLYCAAPMPGSQLYETAPELPEAWADYSQFSPKFKALPTRHLSGKEVLAFRDQAFQRYFRRQEYLDMIEEKFGLPTRDHILEMLKVEVRRE
jgi:anaerobic magnesium-protoporphyrin IX monomethyl ester cyclase